jgi:ribonuclease T1
MGIGRTFAVIAVAAAALAGGSGAEARREPAAISTVAAAELPGEARATLEKIRDNGPFPFDRDGVTFGNYEHMLPSKSRGYYHEYTVKTPGSRSRGARRIVCGGDRERRSISDCYYSDDHYQSFRRILP